MAQKYSYNGVELPELPSGLEGYPYLFITKYQDEAYYLFAAELPISYDKSIPAFVNANDEYLHYHFYSCDADEGYKAWNHVSDPTIQPNSRPGYWHMGDSYSPVWANHDIYYAENYVNTDTVFLKGSSYEVEDSTATDIDPNSLLMGWLVGRRIAGQRKKKPDVPGSEPVLFLYGTPSESGNIGLRVGDTVTYYHGVVAPDINAVYTDELKAELPYCTIFDGLTSEEIDFRASSDPVLKSTNYNSLTHAAYSKYRTFYTWLENKQWNDQGVRTAGGSTHYCQVDALFWTNHDIADKNGVVHIAKSPDPIRVSGIVEYINGIPIYE